jgi:pyrroline-5-carboxylate reductase
MASLGFIGVGNMGGALARAAAKQVTGADLLLANRTASKAQRLAEELGGTLSDNQTIAQTADYIFLGVKPQMLPALAESLASTLAQRETPFVLVTMAAGTSIEKLHSYLGASYPTIRIMPNTPASIGQGMILYAPSADVSPEQLELFLKLMSGAGRFAKLEERLIDAGSSVSGCGPAFVDLFIEALADGGVACGLPRATAIELAAQMVMGSAALVLESGKHPGVLKDAVCSPGGTTIQGVRVLEKSGFRGAVMEAVIAAYEKNFNL